MRALNCLILSTFLLFPLAGQAISENVAKASLGVLSPQGTIGLNYERLFERGRGFSFAPTVGIAGDLTGSLTTLGVRGFLERSSDTSRWYNRCLFIFKDCQRHFSLSGYGHRAGGGTVDVGSGDDRRRYRTDSGYMGSIAIGTRDVINDRWVVDFEIGQRILLSGMRVRQTRGEESASRRQNVEDWSSSLGVSLGVGYLW
jgi:hypothetical protein